MAAALLTRPAPDQPRLAGWLPHFLSLALIWGSSFLFIKVAVDQVHPAYVTLGRVAAGALTLLTVVGVTRGRLPRDRGLWARMAVLALIGNVLPFTLFGYAEQHVSSILAGIWNGTTPLTTLVVVLVLLPQERPTVQRIAGLIVGFLGLLVVLGVWQGVGASELIGQLLCFGAAICYGFALPYTRVIVAGRTESGVALAAVQLILAAAELTIIAPLVAGAPPAPWHLSGAVLGSVLALGALGTGIAFWLNYRVIRVAGPTTSSTVTYLVPVVATVIGVVVLHERLAWYEPVGALVVLLGVAISQGMLGRLRRVSAVAPEPA